MNVATGPARLIIAGVASGVGKTTIATGLMAACAARGLRVQGYKVGPDYIDPTYHRAATGRPSYNLDTWLSTLAMVRERFEAGMRDADIALIEGVMGLFDGRKGTIDSASSAEIARLLNAPVLIVIDVSHMGQSAAAVVSGFEHLDPRVHIAGVILNKVASADHEATVRNAIAHRTGVSVIGAIRRDPLLTLPERHLGLVPAPETTIEIEALGNTIARTVDINEIIELARSAGPLPTPPTETMEPDHPPAPSLETIPAVRIGVALDAVFSFYYPETLEAFAHLGIEVVPFSPLNDHSLPDDLDLLYFGGGFPELFAEQLAKNQMMLASVRSAVQQGIPVYAECGGYMYLGKSCIDASGQSHEMLGILPYTFRMGTARAQLGYREITTARQTIIGPAGMRLRGHEFHWSQLIDPPGADEQAAYIIEAREKKREGYADETILASYVHIPLAANRHALIGLIHSCLSLRAKRNVQVRRS
ncbi:MAG TPA: cobyrinate a,c-diamide synthase [Ktedonobacteraceae bacterium]|jgi:cobyrinic acid a,c-diamide synthase|nr:cobyrinate a,c-diamide synthase [Ktedonobacteraceae bacterium]